MHILLVSLSPWCIFDWLGFECVCACVLVCGKPLSNASAILSREYDFLALLVKKWSFIEEGHSSIHFFLPLARALDRCCIVMHTAQSERL